MREYRAVQSVEGGIGTTLLVPYYRSPGLCRAHPRQKAAPSRGCVRQESRLGGFVLISQ